MTKFTTTGIQKEITVKFNWVTPKFLSEFEAYTVENGQHDAVQCIHDMVHDEWKRRNDYAQHKLFKKSAFDSSTSRLTWDYRKESYTEWAKRNLLKNPSQKAKDFMVDMDWNFIDITLHVQEEYGDLALLVWLAGKYTYQVGNGGHAQYVDNGYAGNEIALNNKPRHVKMYNKNRTGEQPYALHSALRIALEGFIFYKEDDSEIAVRKCAKIMLDIIKQFEAKLRDCVRYSEPLTMLSGLDSRLWKQDGKFLDWLHEQILVEITKKRLKLLMEGKK